jgi:hypothetical protein
MNSKYLRSNRFASLFYSHGNRPFAENKNSYTNQEVLVTTAWYALIIQTERTISGLYFEGTVNILNKLSRTSTWKDFLDWDCALGKKIVTLKRDMLRRYLWNNVRNRKRTKGAKWIQMI